jgi:hypothetical protein
MKYVRLFALSLIAFLVALPAFAAVRQIVIQHFDDEVVVSEDGTIDVTETIEARFSGENWHGLYRSIPIAEMGAEQRRPLRQIQDLYSQRG